MSAAASAPPWLQVSELVIAYPRGDRRWFGRASTFNAVEGVGFELSASEALGVVGESGCGKSSIGRAVLRLQPLAAGRIKWDGRDVTRLAGERLRQARRSIQVVFQDPVASLDPRLTIGDAIGLPLFNHAPVPGTDERRERVAAAMHRVGLASELAKRYPHELSGGQCQRVCIARALVLAPRVLVCDEAVSALDVSTQAQIVGLLDALRRDHGLALLFISHNMAVVRQLCQRVMVLYLGRIVEVSPSSALFTRPLHPYSRALIDSVPAPDPALERVRPPVALAGAEMPSPLAPPSGCAFRTRCLRADARCAAERPVLRDFGAGRWAACHYAEEVA